MSADVNEVDPAVWQQVTRLLHRLCAAADRGDWVAWQGCFTADAQADYTAAGGRRGSVAEVAAGLSHLRGQTSLLRHLVTNIDMWASPEGASGTALFLSATAGPDAGVAATVGGRYEFAAVNSEEQWRLRRFRAAIEWVA